MVGMAPIETMSGGEHKAGTYPNPTLPAKHGRGGRTGSRERIAARTIGWSVFFTFTIERTATVLRTHGTRSLGIPVKGRSQSPRRLVLRSPAQHPPRGER